MTTSDQDRVSTITSLMATIRTDLASMPRRKIGSAWHMDRVTELHRLNAIRRELTGE